jgi:alpha-L-fucosidase
MRVLDFGLAKAMGPAGVSSVCVTTKHDDGFCLWDTTLTRFNTMNAPFGRDILRMLPDACHRRRVPLCLYYSIADWNDPNDTNQGRHHELPPQRQDQPDFPRYLEIRQGEDSASSVRTTERCPGSGGT